MENKLNGLALRISLDFVGPRRIYEISHKSRLTFARAHGIARPTAFRYHAGSRSDLSTDFSEGSLSCYELSSHEEAITIPSRYVSLFYATDIHGRDFQRGQKDTLDISVIKMNMVNGLANIYISLSFYKKKNAYYLFNIFFLMSIFLS